MHAYIFPRFILHYAPGERVCGVTQAKKGFSHKQKMNVEHTYSATREWGQGKKGKEEIVIRVSVTRTTGLILSARARE